MYYIYIYVCACVCVCVCVCMYVYIEWLCQAWPPRRHRLQNRRVPQPWPFGKTGLRRYAALALHAKDSQEFSRDATGEHHLLHDLDAKLSAWSLQLSLGAGKRVESIAKHLRRHQILKNKVGQRTQKQNGTEQTIFSCMSGTALWAQA